MLGCFSLMVAGANGGEVSGGTTGTLAWKDHSLAISGHFLLRQKNGNPQAKNSVELYGRSEIKFQQEKKRDFSKLWLS